MSLSIFSLSILANNPEMDYFIELADTPFFSISMDFSGSITRVYYIFLFSG